MSFSLLMGGQIGQGIEGRERAHLEKRSPLAVIGFSLGAGPDRWWHSPPLGRSCAQPSKQLRNHCE